MTEETNKNVDKTYTDPETGKFLPGNPGGGRPKGSVSIVGEIKRRLQEIPDGQQKTYLELLVNRILKSAIQEGNDQQIRNILQYVEGMPNQPIQHDIGQETLAAFLTGEGNEDRSDNQNTE